MSVEQIYQNIMLCHPGIGEDEAWEIAEDEYWDMKREEERDLNLKEYWR